jgi:hypothetical protein
MPENDGLYIPPPVQDLEAVNMEASAHKAELLRKVLIQKALRKIEALRLYEPLQHQIAVHADKALERLIRGSNRAAKTMTAAIEVSRIVTRQDPFHKMEPPEVGIFYVVGYDFRHIAKVMWPMLAKPGQFRIIRDLDTHEWRVFKPWLEGDREAESRPVPPFIPRRLIKWDEIAWENKREGKPSVVPLHTNWELHFFTSQGEPPKGTRIHGAWFDEEIDNEDWYPEIAARLTDFSGMFIWSATPQAGNPQLYDLHVEAEQLIGEEKPRITEHHFLLSDNPYISDNAKQSLAEKLTEEERRVRIGGEFALSALKVYGEFSRQLHEISVNPVDTEWAVYASVDPGRQRCAVLFVACAPPDHPLANHPVVFDELYLANCTAVKFGQGMAQKLDQFYPVAFIIDPNEAIKHETGSGITIETQYSRALKQYKVKSSLSGHGFVYGYDQVKSGIEAVRKTMYINEEDDMSNWLFVCSRLPNFMAEIKHYRYKKKDGIITDEPHKKNDHLMDGWRYLASYTGLRYRRPSKSKKSENYALSALREKRERKKQRGGPRSFSGVWLGPGSRP